MDKKEIPLDTNNPDRKLLGLKDGGKEEFYCNDCGKHLLTIRIVTLNTKFQSVLTRIAVQCGDCEGFSYVKQIRGQFYTGAPDDDTTIEVLSQQNSDSLLWMPQCDVLIKSTSK